MTTSCNNFLNEVCSNPLFMTDRLRNFLSLRNINFKEIDAFIERATKEEKANFALMQHSVLKFENASPQTQGQVALKDRFVFKGVDRTSVLDQTRFTLFCSLGQSKWYFEKTHEDISQFVESLGFEDRERKDQWQTALLRVTGKGLMQQELLQIQEVLGEVAENPKNNSDLIAFVSVNDF